MSLFPPALIAQAQKLLYALEKKKHHLALAESCTGGLLSALFTESPGASKIITHGFVTYANKAKQQMLGVKKSTLEKHGAVSKPVAKEMARGALKAAKADLAVAITGIAGPGGGSKSKPVGLVFIAVTTKKKTSVQRYQFKGDRSAVRLAALKAALALTSAATLK
jgi:PncC family amidohydrolase